MPIITKFVAHKATYTSQSNEMVSIKKITVHFINACAQYWLYFEIRLFLIFLSYHYFDLDYWPFILWHTVLRRIHICPYTGISIRIYLLFVCALILTLNEMLHIKYMIYGKIHFSIAQPLATAFRLLLNPTYVHTHMHVQANSLLKYSHNKIPYYIKSPYVTAAAIAVGHQSQEINYKLHYKQLQMCVVRVCMHMSMCA